MIELSPDHCELSQLLLQSLLLTRHNTTYSSEKRSAISEFDCSPFPGGLHNDACKFLTNRAIGAGLTFLEMGEPDAAVPTNLRVLPAVGPSQHAVKVRRRFDADRT